MGLLLPVCAFVNAASFCSKNIFVRTFEGSFEEKSTTFRKHIFRAFGWLQAESEEPNPQKKPVLSIFHNVCSKTATPKASEQFKNFLRSKVCNRCIVVDLSCDCEACSLDAPGVVTSDTAPDISEPN